jgi:hypothetical protein
MLGGPHVARGPDIAQAFLVHKSKDKTLPVFYLIQPSSKQIICFDFQKQNRVLPVVFYVPCHTISLHKTMYLIQ